MRERVESEESGLWRLGNGRYGEESQVGGGIVEDGDRSRREDSQSVGAKERRQTNKRMREGEVRQEITGDRRGLVMEGE